MSIAVLIGVHDGLVLAADSASTLVVQTPQLGQLGAANVYDNANKIFNLVKGKPLGCATFGAGSIGNASIGTLIKDFRVKLSVSDPKKNEFGFDITNYTMEQVADLLVKFLAKECEKLKGPALATITIGFLVGGYSSGQSHGESWSVEIQQGIAGKPTQLREKDQPGASWGGQGEALQRLVLGFSPALFQVLSRVNQPPKPPQQIMQELLPLLTANLQAPLVFAPMPIQDAIDLGRFLVHAAIMFSRFLPGPQVVGGPIEVAAITKHEGFKWVSRKHYFDPQQFFENREAVHVVND